MEVDCSDCSDKFVASAGNRRSGWLARSVHDEKQLAAWQFRDGADDAMFGPDSGNQASQAQDTDHKSERKTEPSSGPKWQEA